ncbi:peptide chain release factor N(5)-glutamine methyltransferase [Mucilaginibacter corticis]|uniref:peptide chain release factor N(5)-glutamine methyltransferase n=1 Tax=Mucilaginibacter corticis TaxID=2597670 RepID=A0A556MLH5_9SPHI|nr:peptide chain release factor N(5)-glutamine methyltransferase [Mucilaginibacter corticis]TSJ40702.1 peptide chain release factor N(5)-glutamine methyltransferase [Mucilaginibacter corticis]
MKTIKDVFTTYNSGLAAIYDAQESEAITLMVLTEILHSSKAQIKAFPENELTLTQQEEANNILTQLKTGKPLQYALGYTEFYELKFIVTPATLIPRPETEELVEWAIESVDSRQLAVGELNILDIGTGSGCIAISLKKNLPSAQVSAIDISADALNIAKENALLNDVKITFIQADILNLKSDPDSHRDEIPKSEIIISNPPYVTLDDKKQMHSNVTDFEPHTALFVPEDDPLLFYRTIADFALTNLTENGLLFFEINENFGKETVDLLESKGFKDVELRQDMSGRDRMIKAVGRF